MRIAPIVNPIVFKYRSVLKNEWLKGNMPSVTHGLYGGKLTPENVTLEHIRPHSKGGKTTLNNLALAVDVNNWKRSSKPLCGFLTQEMFDKYIAQFKDIKLPNFDGNNYAKNLTKTIKRVIK